MDVMRAPGFYTPSPYSFNRLQSELVNLVEAEALHSYDFTPAVNQQETLGEGNTVTQSGTVSQAFTIGRNNIFTQSGAGDWGRVRGRTNQVEQAGDADKA